MPIHGDAEEHVVLAELKIVANDESEALMFAHEQLDELSTVKRISVPHPVEPEPDPASRTRPDDAPSAPGA
jgi:hypothetical protein